MNVQIFIVIGIAVMLLLAMSIILFVIMYQRRIENINKQKERELILASIKSEEEERMRIASELHDDIGTTLSSVRLFLHSNDTKNNNYAAVNQSKELLDESIQKIRNISHKLQPVTLHIMGLQKALQSHIQMLNQNQLIRFEITFLNTIPSLDSNIELAVYRTFQELINNIIKHSQTDNIHVTASIEHNILMLCITHNGTGLTQELYDKMLYKQGATGLKNIDNRIKVINATLQFSKSEDQYVTQLTVPIPIEQ